MRSAAHSDGRRGFEPGGRFFAHAAGALAMLVGGCTCSLQQAPTAGDTELTGSMILSTAGPVSARTETSLLHEAAEGDVVAAAALERLVRAQHNAVPVAFRPGNRAALLVDGPQAYGAMFASIAEAEDHIHMETYILEDDTAGRELADLLLERAAAGVRVRVIYDSFGSRATSSAYFDRLRAGGVESFEFHPLNPLKDVPLLNLNHRNHRKLLVIDGFVAFTGGMNISAVYNEASFQPANGKDPLTQGWRDTHVQLTGPVALDLDRYFLERWSELHGTADTPLERELDNATVLASAGDDLVALLLDDGGDSRHSIHAGYLAAIRSATTHIWITQAYFTPDRALLRALEDAARRGVDVRLMLGTVTDSPGSKVGARARYGKLLRAGARIFERSDALVHAKTVVIDGAWSMVGSSNLNNRSRDHDDELNTVIGAADFANEMRTLFELDMAHAEEVTERQWASRPLSQRLLEALARPFEYWL